MNQEMMNESDAQTSTNTTLRKGRLEFSFADDTAAFSPSLIVCICTAPCSGHCGVGCYAIEQETPVQSMPAG